jgi:hypothetical protein
LRGLPFPSRGQGDLAQGSLAVAGVVSWSSCWSVSASESQSHRACSPHTFTSRAAHTSTTPTPSPSLDGKLSLIHSAALPEKHTRRRESLGGIWNPFPVPTPNINLPPDSPSLRPRADIQHQADGQVPPAITQQIFRSLRYSFARTDLPPDALRGVVLQVNYTEPASRNTPEVVAETPPTTRMAETMSPIGIANVRITSHTIARASSDANGI